MTRCALQGDHGGVGEAGQVLGEVGADLVQLGAIEVEAAALRGPGSSLEEVLDAYHLLGSGDLISRAAPTGWRLVRVRPAGQMSGASHVLAAPHPHKGGGWTIVVLDDHQGRWHLSVDPGPLMVVPARAARRAALVLRWAQPLSIPAAQVTRLSIEVRNLSEQPWHNLADDSAHVIAWLLDEAGSRIEDSPWFAYGHGRCLPDLAPGQRATLQVAWSTPRIETLPPGRYGLDALAPALGLHAQPATIELT